jgi:hypothetical protein
VGGEHCSPHAGIHGGQDAVIGGSGRRAAGGRGSHTGGEGGRARADVFPESGPKHVLGVSGARTRRRGRGCGQVQCLGGCQDCGYTVPAPARRRIGLPLQPLYLPELLWSVDKLIMIFVACCS